ncbi:hypothetical protein LUZ60_015585 [Juncus effusus]|nr:hypothetical protein LUZ60_015585 [Juncus effusus]
MHTLFFNNLFPSVINPKRIKYRKPYHHNFVCKASNNSSNSSNNNNYSWMMDMDLYNLLGIERTSGQPEIKAAYRALQKKCHPDVAGPTGHDMAIVLNEVYSFLSDPVSRSVYDQEQAKLSEFEGYTGKPLYSSWLGPQSETRAVFVDEVKCVGCLKCALFANKTFAIESVYGRARVVQQWADSEDKIFDAIQTCPIDCISVVERSDLAALEFLMSKQPRGSVRISQGNTGGARVSNIFADVEKFQNRFHEMKQKASKNGSKDTEILRGSKNSAVQEIISLSNLWYWQPLNFTTNGEASLTNNPIHRRTKQPFAQKLLEASARRNAQTTKPSPKAHNNSENYWKPSQILPSPYVNFKADTAPSSRGRKNAFSKDRRANNAKAFDEMKKIRIDLKTPLAIAILSASFVAYRGENVSESAIKEHFGGEMAMKVVNSFEMQILLAGATWFVIGLAVVGLVEFLEFKSRNRNN